LQEAGPSTSLRFAQDDCGNCASICPSGAIFAEDELPAEKAHFAAKNKTYFN
jgi:ferredoxin